MNGDDRTVIRPMPGGRRPPPADSSAAPPPPPSSAQPSSPTSYDRAQAADLDDKFLASLSRFGLNPLVEPATPLLLLAAGLRGTRNHPDVPGLHAEVSRWITQFQREAEVAGVPREHIAAASYALCTFMDEVVMNTPWAAGSIWAGKPLLLAFHNDRGGGEKFFQMVERLLADHTPKREIMEFFYVCMALGLEGKYRIDAHGSAALAEIRERLYRRIRGWREETSVKLSPRWEGVEDRRYRLVRAVPAWVFLSIAVAIAVGAFLTFHTMLNSATTPVFTQLNEIRQATFASPVVGTPAPDPSLPTLAELLADANPSLLLIEEGPDRTRLTLKGGVFASGSVEVQSVYRQVIDRIAQALNQLPGPVMVVGHTDNVPIHSLRFADNHELSLARARNVAERLRATLQNPERLSIMGKGSSEPRYLPQGTSKNRQRNRRVEIVYRHQGAG